MRRSNPLYLVTSLLLAFLLALAPACGEEIGDPGIQPSPDASLSDGGTLEDAGGQDAATAEDAGSGADAEVLPDAGLVADGGVVLPLPGFGSISGECGVLDTELLDTDSHILENHIDFAQDPYDDADKPLLTSGGQGIVSVPNAGGNSVLSEVFAFEMLARCELGDLLKTEMEIVYDNPNGKMTDLLVNIDGLKIGVSVVRAIKWPFDDPYQVADAKALLEKKLQGILDSTLNVSDEDVWTKQILYVLAYSQQHADAFQSAYQQVDASLRSDTVVMMTVTDGADGFIYNN